jgi:hypothetical protein
VALLAVVLGGAMVVHGGILLFKTGEELDYTTAFMAGAGHYGEEYRTRRRWNWWSGLLIGNVGGTAKEEPLA